MIQSSVRVLKFLIEERQADVIVLEACPGATHRLDRHLVRGEGNAEHALVAMGNWNYASQEILSLVTWLGDTQQAQSRSQRPVRIMGCDCQSMDGPKAELLRLLQEFVRIGALEQDAADESAALVTALPTDRDLGQFVELILREMDGQAPKESRMADIEAWQAKFVATVSVSVARACRRLQEIGLALPASVSRDDRFFFERCGRHLEQVVQFYSPGDAMHARDQFMAENILALRRHFQPERIVLLSHNLHVARVPIVIRGYQFVTMGHHLARELGDAYRSIGSVFHTGRYLAMTEYQPIDDIVEDAHTPGPQALESILQQAAVDRQSPGLLIDFRQSASQGNESPWSEGIEMRLGEAARQGSYADCFFKQRPDLQFDAMLFLPESSPITVLPGYYQQAIDQWKPDDVSGSSTK